MESGPFFERRKRSSSIHSSEKRRHFSNRGIRYYRFDFNSRAFQCTCKYMELCCPDESATGPTPNYSFSRRPCSYSGRKFKQWKRSIGSRVLQSKSKYLDSNWCYEFLSKPIYSYTSERRTHSCRRRFWIEFCPKFRGSFRSEYQQLEFTCTSESISFSTFCYFIDGRAATDSWR
ncbi:hypothetical protein LEP1GSC048_3539 [Leptospira santarosai serovar Shermani str. 1342KT]|nr:hypothetical protein LEP1GSC048_3539 [Leptospira santarosai serovar Shermani str. 1342KT]